MRSSMLCLGLLALLSACSSSGGGGSSGGAGNPGAVAKAQMRGQFSVEKQSDLSPYGGTPEGYSLPEQTCDQSSTQGHFDSRARAGDSFIELNSSASQSSSSSITQTRLIQKLDDTSMTQSITMSDIQTVPQVRGVPSQVQVIATCTLTPKFDCDVKFQNWQPPSELNTMFAGCRVLKFSDDSKTKGTVALGTYKLMQGPAVYAQATHRESSGVTIGCGTDDKVVGTGTQISDEIETQDLVTAESSNCAPVTSRIFDKTVLKLDDGTIVYASTSEIVAAPKR